MRGSQTSPNPRQPIDPTRIRIYMPTSQPEIDVLRQLSIDTGNVLPQSATSFVGGSKESGLDVSNFARATASAIHGHVQQQPLIIIRLDHVQPTTLTEPSDRVVRFVLVGPDTQLPALPYWQPDGQGGFRWVSSPAA